MTLHLCLALAISPLVLAVQDPEEPVVEEVMVITASRSGEKRVEAPASIEVVQEEDLKSNPTSSFLGATSQIKGLDFAHTGLLFQKISVRGFTKSYRSRVLFLVDGRLATLPGAGLQQNELAPNASIDVKSMELVLGPASAMYGPDAGGGVLNLITKDPWDQDGGEIKVRLGQQELVDGSFRYAHRMAGDRFGFKVTGQWLEGEDFDSPNIYLSDATNQTINSPSVVDAAIQNGTAFAEFEISDPDIRSQKAEISAYYKGQAFDASLAIGESDTNGFLITNNGRYRMEDFKVRNMHLKASTDHFYFHVAKSESDAGNTFATPEIPALLAQGISLDDAQKLTKFVDESSLLDADLQFRKDYGWFQFIAGTSYRVFEPNSKGTYLDDFIDEEGNQDTIELTHNGYYTQGDFWLFDRQFRISSALRYDDSSEFASSFSPKLAFTFNHGLHYWRMSYNQAQMDPVFTNTHLYLLGGIIQGNQNGWIIQDQEGNIVRTIEALEPEKVESVELGYRAIFGKLMLDGALYRSEYEDFQSPIHPVASPQFGLVAVNPSTGTTHPFLLSIENFGEAEVEGLDIGLDWEISSQLALSTSYSYQKLTHFGQEINLPDESYNAPKNKAKMKLSWNPDRPCWASFHVRYNQAYDFVSGRWVGRVPEIFKSDLAAGYQFKKGWKSKLLISNLFDSKKQEFIGTPVIPRHISVEISKTF